MSFGDGHLFLGGIRGSSAGIWKYDIADPDDLDLVGRIPGRDRRWDDQFSIPIGNLIAISDDQNVEGYVGSYIAVHDTEPDTRPPVVDYVNPPYGAVDQAPGSRIGLSFSDQIELASVDPSTLLVRPVGGPAVTGKWGHTQTVVTFWPDQPLEAETEYEIVAAAGGITDLVGNALENEFRSVFRTGAASPRGTGGGIDTLTAAQTGRDAHFTAYPTPGAREYRWDFGDGHQASGESVSHSYDTPGRFTVTLSVLAADGRDVYEAEDATLSGGVAAASDARFHFGTGYARYPDATGTDVKVQWQIERTSQGTVDVDVRYSNGGAAELSLDLVVNGSTVQAVAFERTGTYQRWRLATVEDVALEAASNTLELIARSGTGPYVDRLSLPSESSTVVASYSATQLVHRPLTANEPAGSSTVVVTADQATAWAVNPDANTVTAVHTVSLAKAFEAGVGRTPRTLAQAPDGTIWVANEGSHDISVLDSGDGTVIDTIELPYASMPYGIAFAPDGSAAYVTLQALGRLLRIDPATRTVVHSLALGPDGSGIVPKVRGIAVDGDSGRILVARFVSPDEGGEIYDVEVLDQATRLSGTISLGIDPGPDTPDTGRGLPNYIGSFAISPDGVHAHVPSKKDNIERGSVRDGQALTHESTVRTAVSRIDLSSGREDLGARVDLNDHDMPSALAFSPLGDLLFAAVQGSNAVHVIDAYSGAAVAGMATGRAPQGLALDDQGRLYVQNFMGRSLSVFDAAALLRGTESSARLLAEIGLVADETLPDDVLRGKRVFYDASSSRMSLDGYLSCSSCHLDGGQDGRTWDFTDRGEGLRNTISLEGRGGTVLHGPVHWTGNFDEIQDFEGVIRSHFGGSGLMSDDDFDSGTRSDPLDDPKSGLNTELDALAAYVSSLTGVPPSPYRNVDGSLTAAGQTGRQVFASEGCGDCHGGAEFTDSAPGIRHDVGTIGAASGKRLGETLAGLDTPTLKGVWATAPYLHDGSASTLGEAVEAHSDVSLSDSELGALVSYLQQIDEFAGADGEAATWEIAVAPSEIEEADTATVTVSIANGVTFSADQAVTLTASGTATAEDYALGATTLTLPAGADAVSTTLTAAEDDAEEADETVTVSAVHAGSTVGTATVTITDGASFTDVKLTALALSGLDIGTFDAATMEYAVAAAESVAETTVTATPEDPDATVTITDANGSTSGATRDVALDYGANTITVAVTAADGETTAMYTVTVTRQPPLTASVHDVPPRHDGVGDVEFELRFSEALPLSYRTLLAGYEVDGGTLRGVRRIEPPGNVRWRISVKPAGDGEVMALLQGNQACGAARAVCAADGRMLSNSPVARIPGPLTVPVVSIVADATPVSEGTAAAFTLMRTGDATEALTVAVTVAESGAMASGVLPTEATFGSQASSSSLSVATTDDAVVEESSTVTATVSAGTGYAVAAERGAAEVLVVDDDTATFAVAASPSAIREGDAATVTVSIANGVTFAADQTVTPTASGTAAAEDYTLSETSLTLSAGGNAVSATLTATDDEAKEPTETVTVTASHGGREIGTVTVTIGANEPPTITGASSVDYAENGDGAVAAYTATDPEGETIAWSLSGADDGVFSMTAGELAFLVPPNYENPADADGDNVYRVSVKATDSSGASASFEVTVRVTDVADPNIVLVLADEGGYELFGAYGSTQYSTPRLDGLSDVGTRFTHAYSKPASTPSRVALMTGKSNVRNYVDARTLRPGEYTIADLFGDAGYATAIAGKWQLQGKPNQVAGVAADASGFDTYCLWHSDASDSRYWEPTFECDEKLVRHAAGDYGPDKLVDFLHQFIDSNRDRPFFAYYSMLLPHMPFHDPPDTQCAADDDQCALENMIAHLDRNVGRVYDKLDDLGLLDNTVFVFTSDNGTHDAIVSHLDGEAIRGDKGMPTGGGTRVPLIVRAPGVSGGRVVDDLIDITDLLPTLAEAAGLTIPADIAVDGVSFWNRLQGGSGNPREWTYTYYFPEPYAAVGGLRTPRHHPEAAYTHNKGYKLYASGDLYDLSADPHEVRPLADGDQESAATRAALQAALDSMPAQGQAIRWSHVTADARALHPRPRWRPALKSASVNGATLSLEYAGRLDTGANPGAGAFSVAVDGSGRSVTAASLTEEAVALTLASAVTAGETVTVSYTAPQSQPLRSKSGRPGNVAANLTDVTVLNETPENTSLTVESIASGAQHPTKHPFSVTITFSEPVTGLTLSEIEVANGTPSDLAGSGSTRTLTVTPDADFDGDVTVTVPAGVAEGSASNTNEAGSETFAADTLAPALAASDAATVNRATLTLTFDEALGAANIASSAFTVTGATARSISAVAVSGSTVQLTLSVPVLHGETGLEVDYGPPTAESLVDAVGNRAAAIVDRAVTNRTPATTLSTAIGLTVNEVAVAEGGPAQTVTVTGMLNRAARSGATPVTIEVGSDADTAAEGTDYANVDDVTLTIPAYATSATASFTLIPINDRIDEPRERLAVTGSTTVAGLTVTPTGGFAIEIEDDDPAPALEPDVSSSTIDEDGGAATVTISTGSGSTFAADQTVQLAVAGTAEETVDYTISAKTLTLAAGDGSVSATLTAIDDETEEPDETVTVTAVHGGTEIGTVTVTIPGNDAPSTDAELKSLGLSGLDIGTFDPAMTAYAATAVESVAETTVTATPNDDGASVAIADAHGSTAGTTRDVALDYGENTITATATAADGETTKAYTVTVTRAYTLPAATIAAGTSPVSEGTDAQFTVSLDKAAKEALTVAVSVSETGQAVSGTASSVTIDPGATAWSLTLATDDDAVVEDASTVTVALAAGDGYTLGAADSGAVMVEDGDAATWKVAAGKGRIEEGEQTPVTVSIANGVTFAADQAVTLTATGTAAAGDYTLSETSLTLATGDGAVTATLTATDDEAEEQGETVRVSASHGGQEIGAATVTITANDAPPSVDATLSGLDLSGVDIGGFDPETTDYAAEVGNDVESTTVKATPNDAAASVTITDAQGSTAGTARTTQLDENENAIAVAVTAEDGIATRRYAVTVTRAPTSIVAWGERVADRDIDLSAAYRPRGLGSDGETLWAADWETTSVFAYALADGARREARDFGLGAFLVMALYADGETLWAADYEGGVYAYRLSDGERLEASDLDAETMAEAGNGRPAGLWSDGATMWVADQSDRHVYAYRLSDGARESDKEFALVVGDVEYMTPFGLWSDGETVLATDWLQGTVRGYALAGGARQSGNDIGEAATANDYAAGLWSDGETLWVVDENEQKAYAYAAPGLHRPAGRSVGLVSGLSSRALSVPGETAAGLPVSIPDPGLRGRIAVALGKRTEDTIGVDELAALVVLDARNVGVADLTGLEYAVNLEGLDLGHNPVADVRPLLSLSALRRLNLDGMGADLRELAALRGLKELSLRRSARTDVWPLPSMNGLEVLDLAGNRIDDVAALAALANLRVLNVSGNRVADLSPLAALERLRELHVGGNLIVDFSPLEERAGLRVFGGGNQHRGD